MAGSDAGGRNWGRRYDDAAAGLVEFSNSLLSAMVNYSVLLRQAGVNHELAEARAAGGVAIVRSPLTATDFASRVEVTPSSIGDSGPGLQGAIDIASAAGIPCPNGDTGKLRDAADAWMAFQQNLMDARVGLLGVAGSLYERIESPDIADAYRELRQIAEGCADGATICGSLADACRTHADQLDRARDGIKAAIEQFAIEEAAAIAVGVGLAWLTVGVSAAASAAIAAGRFSAAAKKVRDLIDDLGGRENVVREMLAELDRRALTPGRFEEVVTIEGVAVTVRGAVVNGVTKIGTAFIP